MRLDGDAFLLTLSLSQTVETKYANMVPNVWTLIGPKIKPFKMTFFQHWFVSCKESMRQTEKQKVSAGEIEETIKRNRGKESQSTIHRVKIGRMSRSEAILSHNAKEKEELGKK